MRFSIDHESLVPLHAQVEKLLREMIEAPEYQNNALLPNETLLAKQLGISHNTVRQALNKLVYEGLLGCPNVEIRQKYLAEFCLIDNQFFTVYT
ncbi:MAG: winged helix-turn-helix domain-containing protein [Bacteroidales bacterium]|jgi:GntR family transcriptional regulator